jgi:hypothetical protein
MISDFLGIESICRGLLNASDNSDLPELSLKRRNSNNADCPCNRPLRLKIANYFSYGGQICKHFEAFFVLYIDNRDNQMKVNMVQQKVEKGEGSRWIDIWSNLMHTPGSAGGTL